MKRRVLSWALVAVTLAGVCIAATKWVTPKRDPREEVAAFVRDWVLENYSEHYTLTDYRGEITGFTITGDSFRAGVLVTVRTKLKYADVESHPFVQGMLDALAVRSLKDAVAGGTAQVASALSAVNPDMSARTAQELAALVIAKYLDLQSYVGVTSPLAIDYEVTGRVSRGNISRVSLVVYTDGEPDRVDAAEYVPKGKDALRAEGRSHALELVRMAEARAATHK